MKKQKPKVGRGLKLGHYKNKKIVGGSTEINVVHQHKEKTKMRAMVTLIVVILAGFGLYYLAKDKVDVEVKVEAKKPVVIEAEK